MTAPPSMRRPPAARVGADHRPAVVRIPAGLRSAQTLRLVGHGAMHLRGGGRGDLLLPLDVDGE
ncbi:hypothetical protein [Streptomyces decoyicus]|uniref:hypothetical protein n=1 Tax=Streptomyces decoyicus TaxID=249567 RepID=UPI0033B48641